MDGRPTRRKRDKAEGERSLTFEVRLEKSSSSPSNSTVLFTFEIN